MLPVERVKISKSGRLVIPAPYRRALGLVEGGDVLLRLRDGCLELESPSLTLERARQVVRKYAAGRDLVGELLSERREAASADE
ncbi:MAG: AbrB/MazE/SpoVT family DNA-binding domain-containing protein [Deltaproteobacteria bacterium]|nr:AbrB/MazE/SpoVT family DNA-binding domain-containing protein [Deltaproteobacteria bacterium]